MSPDRPSSLSVVRRTVVANLDKPLPEVIDHALRCLVEALDVRAAFLGRLEDGALEIIGAIVRGGPPIEPGMRFALEETFLAAETADGVLNVRDAARRDPFRALPMRQRLGITSYLGAPLEGPGGNPLGTIAVLGKGARVFAEQDQDLLLVVAGLLAPRLQPEEAARANGQGRTPASAVRLASNDVKEPLAILRGYADMLTNNEVPAADLPLVARRLAMQSETLMRVADQVLLMSRLPLELAFTVRVSLNAVAQSGAQRIRDRLAAAGMQLRVQLDTQAEVWGDAALLEAALDEMLHNVLRHARGATVVHLRLRPTTGERVQLIVKDDGPGISGERLAELFRPAQTDGAEPRRGNGLGVYLLRRVADAHGGRAWANSLEGKGTTFYLELPVASPDGHAARISAVAGQTPA